VKFGPPPAPEDRRAKPSSGKRMLCRGREAGRSILEEEGPLWWLRGLRRDGDHGRPLVVAVPCPPLAYSTP